MQSQPSMIRVDLILCSHSTLDVNVVILMVMVMNIKCIFCLNRYNKYFFLLTYYGEIILKKKIHQCYKISSSLPVVMGG